MIVFLHVTRVSSLNTYFGVTIFVFFIGMKTTFDGVNKLNTQTLLAQRLRHIGHISLRSGVQVLELSRSLTTHNRLIKNFFTLHPKCSLNLNLKSLLNAMVL